MKGPGRRAAEYWFVDGLPELIFGIALVLLGGFPLITSAVGLIWKPIEAVLSIGFLALFWWDRKIIGWFKARLTYPRTGYVRPPGEPFSPPSDENVTWFRNRTVIVFFLVSSVSGLFSGRWSPTLAMLGAACILYLFNRRLEHPYSLWSVAVLALAGLPFAWVPLRPSYQTFVPILLGGLWLLVRGLWTLATYLHDHPAAGDLAVE